MYGGKEAIDLDRIRRSVNVVLDPGEHDGDIARCEAGEIAIGGGYSGGEDIEYTSNSPTDPDEIGRFGGEGWSVIGTNHSDEERSFNVFVNCVKVVS